MREIEILEGVDVKVEGGKVVVGGNGYKIEREFDSDCLKIEVKDKKVLIVARDNRRKINALAGTFEAHIRNMITGIITPFSYTLKIVYAHFPMNVKVQGNVFQIGNFLGEKHNRSVKMPEDVKVSIQGDSVFLESHDKEKAGLAAGRIEKLCYKGRRDLRKFQDGIYLVKNDAK